jgi:DNA-binding NtrC family response regulator
MYTNRNIKVCIIDDDMQMREMLKDFIIDKFPSAEISSYSTGEDALRNILVEPNLILLDYHLDSIDATAMNGLQVLVKLRERFSNLPIIFISGQEKTEIAANTMKYGAWDYIVKNENTFNRLLIHINNILGQADLHKNLGTQKFFNRLLAIIVGVIILGMIIMRITT